MADPAEDVLGAVLESVRWGFSPTQSVPPRGGGSEQVRFFAGDQLPLAAWDAHAEGCGCKQPFLWVRLSQRYKTTPVAFPAPVVTPGVCHQQWRALEIEYGVGRCAVTGEEPTFAEYLEEANVALDDSYRVDLVGCRITSCLEASPSVAKVAVGPVVPFGPQGGIIAVFSTIWVMLNG